MGFKVRRAKCSTCIFGPNSPISRARLEHYRSEWKRQDTHQICHLEAMNGSDDEVCCRGFYDAHPGLGRVRRMAEHLGVVDIVD